MFTSENVSLNGAPVEGEVHIPSGCAVSAIIDRSGKRMTGEKIIRSIATMHDRSNGLGGGFAGYGIYPHYKDYYAFHLFFNDFSCKKETEDFLLSHFEIVYSSEMKTRKVKGITNEPLIYRYFLYPLSKRLANSLIDEEQYVVKCVNTINAKINGAYVFSSGKDMGIFKGVGFPEDVGRFYLLDEEYEGYMWTAHGRYPTNTPGWWGGAHPFGLLNYSVVHNGEISSYDANRRYIEMFGYKCTLQTDTEVITYIIDYLLRVKHLTLEEVAKVISASFWSTIDEKSEEDKAQETYLRKVFPSLLINGPFSIIFGFDNGLMALNDRLKLRSMVCAEKGDLAFVSSEECGIRVIEQELDKIYAPAGGQPVIYTLNGKTLGEGGIR
ncbi:MAG: glutamine amidotransferase family protein [Clostridia bacterium]|nr:glutamine amidotransferase family protein [Clostridia bacterium]